MMLGLAVEPNPFYGREASCLTPAIVTRYITICSGSKRPSPCGIVTNRARDILPHPREFSDRLAGLQLPQLAYRALEKRNILLPPWRISALEQLPRSAYSYRLVAFGRPGFAGHASVDSQAAKTRNPMSDLEDSA